MSKIQSHAECSHASSKTARAKCRRDRAKMADAFSSVAAEFGNVQMGTAEVVAPEPVFEPVKVTAENWRDFRETPVRIAVRLTDDEESERSEEHTSELQSLMRNSYAVFCLNKKTH